MNDTKELTDMTDEQLTTLLIALRRQMREMSDTDSNYLKVYRRWGKVSDEITSRRSTEAQEQAAWDNHQMGY